MSEYAIRVDGQLSAELVTAFPDLTPDVCPVQTVLHGKLPDQSALLGVLAHLDELGVPIIEVQQLPELPAVPPESDRRPGGLRVPVIDVP